MLDHSGGAQHRQSAQGSFTLLGATAMSLLATATISLSDMQNVSL
jgi:hypothetical protein